MQEGDLGQEEQSFSYVGCISSGDLMYSNVNIVNDAVYLEFAKGYILGVLTTHRHTHTQCMRWWIYY